MSVVFKEISPERIFHQGGSGWIRPIAENYAERWWDPEQDEIRELLRSWYIDLWNEENGYFDKLLEDIRANGIRNPVVVTRGEPFRPDKFILPPDPPEYICEGPGGSRIWAAMQLDLLVPCVINDRLGDDTGAQLGFREEVEALFTEDVKIRWNPVEAVYREFTHMPGLTMEEQKKIRKRTQAEIYERWQQWLEDQEPADQRSCAEDVRTDFERGWSNGLPETPCGAGSKLEGTRAQRQKLAEWAEKYNLQSVVDIGAGDLNWIGHVDWDVEYLPLDLVPRHESVVQFDILQEVPDQADLALFLWVGNHMTREQVKTALDNIRASGCKYLAITHGPWMWPEMDLKAVEQYQIRIHRDGRRTNLKLVAL